MYAEDSFFTLGPLGRVGLVIVSILFAMTALGMTWVMTRLRPLIIRVPIWGVLFITFIWASPQGYYLYYRLIFDGLPAQSVVGSPPPPDVVLAFLTFSHQATLSAHSVGVLGWAMMIVAIWPRRRKCRDAAN